MNAQQLGKGSSPGGATFSRVADEPGKAPSKKELEALGVDKPEKVIEFDVKSSELKPDELGDIRLPDPTSLKGRNAVSIDVD